LEQALDLAVDIGAPAVEIAAGGQSSAPHMQIDRLLADRRALDEFRGAIEARGLRIGALNCSSWVLHPVHDRRHEAIILSTIELAARLGVPTIVTMSGCPGDGEASSTINWVWYPWPGDAVELRDRQWAAAVERWRTIARRAEDAGITRLAFELHPLHLVYNVPTLLRMREEVGPVIGANLDPSHLFWQQMDPLAVIRTLREAVYHVHLKDTQPVPDQLALAGVLDGRSFARPEERAWNFRTVGVGHGVEFWAAFIEGLREVGYTGVLSIENEDAYQPAEDGVRQAASFINSILAERNASTSA
ncbi:MAG TPA: sugar phosphate isomerase/epimerase, partial [Candidatus Limnocylindrales bacterium]